MSYPNLSRRRDSLTDPTKLRQAAPYFPHMVQNPGLTINLKQRTSTSWASSLASADDQPLFMNGKSARRNHGSLSPLSNGSTFHSDAPPEPSFIRQKSTSGDNVAWQIIDREISEWQNVCATGRPSWWSPISKWSGAHEVKFRRGEEVRNSSSWQIIGDDNVPPDRRFDRIQRAVADDYAIDNSNVNDLAHLIAIQLLGACFTLPPDHIRAHKSTELPYFDTFGSNDLPDSRLISSLRMHTESRYAPAFGHQARNTSPVLIWQGALDGTSQTTSPGESIGHRSPQVKTSDRMTRIRRAHHARHNTEASAPAYPVESSPEEPRNSTECLSSASTSRSYRNMNHVLHLPRSATAPATSDRTSSSAPQTPSEKKFYISPGHSILEGRKCPSPGSFDPQPLAPGSRYSVQAFLHSEPHPVFIQPVKKLVVKQWQSFRRRFGHSLSLGCPDPDIGSAGLAPSHPVSQASTPTQSSGTASPSLSSDGKERRRRARERGDIHSSSVESQPRYNTPTGLSPTSPAVLLGSHAPYQYADPLNVAATIASSSKANTHSILSGASSVSSSGITSPRSYVSMNEMSDPNLLSPLSSAGKGQGRGVKSSASHHRKHRIHKDRRQQGRSQLSEMHTPDDYQERNLLSALGSELASPTEAIGPDLAIRQGSLLNESQIEYLNSVGLTHTEQVSSPSDGSMRRDRPRLSRRSTSGTQVFTPSSEGVEVDGLPVGPAADVWDEVEKGKGRRIRSFLCLM